MRRRTIKQETASLSSALRGSKKLGKINTTRACYFLLGCILLCMLFLISKFVDEEKKMKRHIYQGNELTNTAQKQPLQDKELKSQEKKLDSSSQGQRTKTLVENCPPPTDIVSYGGQVLMRPAFGSHRFGVDAVFAFAQGYPLKAFVGFVESLHKTGFDGDIVLSISSLSTLKMGVEEYLRTKSNVIAYAVDWICYMKSGDPIAEPEAESDCNIAGFYGNTDGKLVADPRLKRPLATARFELYWAWSLQYSPKSMFLLIDFRDTYFQLNPFTEIERSSSTSTGGILYVFEENSIVPLGKSEYNSRWIRQGYGQKTMDALKDKTIICSGSTMGEQVAIKQYLQCLIQQFDVTKCQMKGCDQGFHNYIFHQNLMNDMDVIENVVFIKHGHGAINNLAILRSKLLSEQGLYDKEKQLVLNWDGSVSPVVHQYDRDEELSDMMRKRLSTMLQEWMKTKK